MELCDVILVAAGRGERLGGEVPKQFQLLLGRPVYLWSLEVFLNWPLLGNIRVVVPEDWVLPVQESLEPINIHKKIQVVKGGTLRQESSVLGLHALEGSANPWVMIHDAARPNLKPELLEKVWNARKRHAGVIPGLKVPDTVKRVRRSEAFPDPVVSETVPREDLWMIQTPQLFEAPLLTRAYEKLGAHTYSDDAGLYEKAGYNVIVVEGDYDNLKITFAEDFERVSSRLRSRHSPL